MIVKWFLEVLAGFLSWVLSLFPEWTTPAWVTSAASTLGDVAAGVGDISNVLPITIMALCLGLVLAAYVVALGIRMTRIIASFFTAGGGSAA